MSLFHRHTDYSIEQGNVRYMDGSSLLRPVDMPRSQKIIMAVFVVIAVIIGFRLAAGAITAVSDSNTQSKTSVEENLARPVSYNLPVLTQMADMDDQAILDSLTAAGYTVYNQTAEGTAGLDLVKLPSDVTVADAAAMYAKGVGSLSASQAALLLNGGWTLTVDRADTLSMAVKYADFSSSTLEAAIQSAIAAEAPLTDDCSAVERLGKEVYLTPGWRENIKITTPEDMEIARFFAQKFSFAESNAVDSGSIKHHDLSRGDAS